jgi:hypothetical protein
MRHNENERVLEAVWRADHAFRIPVTIMYVLYGIADK